MKRMPHSLIILALMVMCIAPESRAFVGGAHDSRSYIPKARLLEPIYDTVDLNGKKELVFKWSSHESAPDFRQYYDFRLYKGYDMYESTLIFKEKVSPEQYELALPSDNFENGQIYTWCLRQVYTGIRKSERNFNSFKIIK